jgi:long-chain acyl-CoA synthetase
VIIVTAGGTNAAPSVLEDRLRGNPLISEYMVVADGRPYIARLVTLDPEVLESWKRQHGKSADACAAPKLIHHR